MTAFPLADVPSSAAAAAMRVLMIGLEWFDDNPGGGGRYLADAARGLAARGHRVTVLVPRLNAADPAHEVVDGVRLHRFALARPWDKFTAIARMLPELIAHEGPFDVVHSHFALYGAVPLYHPAVARARRVCQFQGPWAAESAVEGASGASRLAKYALERLAYARCDRFVTLSESFKGLLARDYAVDPTRISVVPAGIDQQRFALGDRETARRALGWGAGPTFFAMRRLVHRMGLEVLLEAFARVHAAHNEARLAIAGTGPLSDALQAQARALGVAEAVRFLGRVSDAALVQCYQAADL
ncbi:MAG TPA: glycosyltransferase family 4 protein, partial [Oscillatoriaceae cyanobacterium]